MPDWMAIYGPPGGVLVVLSLVIKYLLDELKQTREAHKVELASWVNQNQQLQQELLAEARGNAELAESIKRVLEAQ